MEMKVIWLLFIDKAALESKRLLRILLFLDKDINKCLIYTYYFLICFEITKMV